MRRTVLLVMLLISAVACTDRPETAGPDADVETPTWVQSVYPEPGATAAVPDAVEVDHAVTSGNEDVRLIVDGTDVTTYATFDAARIRYESGDGPVVLEQGDHWAEVQRVTLPAAGEQFEVLDSFRWEFRTG